MDDAGVVCGLERLGDLTCDRQRLVELDRPARDPRAEVFAIDELHDQRALIVEAVDLRDARVVECRERPRFALEAREPLRVGRERLWQDLQRDLTPQRRIARAIDLTHAAFAKLGEDLVGSEPSACGERHC
jgi:hypothetical protein